MSSICPIAGATYREYRSGAGGKVVEGSLTVNGKLTAQRVVVKDAFSAPAILASSITTGIAFAPTYRFRADSIL